MKSMRAEILEKILELGNGWKITPAGGATGEAYIAQFNAQKLFLKRNSSPFLAVLSAEGIVPKLIWTKRMENGDVITAQHWLEGRELKAVDMKSPKVAEMLSKIHNSKALLDMLKRINQTPLYPISILNDVRSHLDRDLNNTPIIKKAISFLKAELSEIHTDINVVCHCDVNHNNWILSTNEEELYLIDWDGARIADPALDIGLLLYCYIPYEEWEKWLDTYGIPFTKDLKKRMNWYVTAQVIIFIAFHKRRGESQAVKQWLIFLEQMFEAR